MTKRLAGTTHCGNAGCDAACDPGRSICERCEKEARSALDRLWRRETHTGTCLLDELGITATRQSKLSVAMQGAAGAVRPLPYEPHAARVLSEDTMFLADAAVHFGASRVYRQRRDGRGAAGWLLHRFDEIRGHPDVGTLAQELAWRVPRAVRAVDQPPSTWFAGRCLRCGADLYADEGAGVIRCRCGEQYDVDEQRQRLLAGIEDRLASAVEISRAVHLLERPVSVSMIDNWVARGQLLRRGSSSAGHFLYRIGDVLRLVDLSAQRRSEMAARGAAKAAGKAAGKAAAKSSN